MPTLRQLAARLRAAADPAAALAEVATEVATEAVDDVQGRMLAGLQPDGTKQPPLKRWPRKSGNPSSPLVDYGRMYGTVAAAVDGTTIVLSASGPGAAKHQRTRPFLGLSAGAKVTIGKLIMAGYVRRMRSG